MRPAARSALAGLGLVALVAAATSPAWRLLLLESRPTAEELLQWRCSASTAAPRRAGVGADRATTTAVAVRAPSPTMKDPR